MYICCITNPKSHKYEANNSIHKVKRDETSVYSFTWLHLSGLFYLFLVQYFL